MKRQVKHNELWRQKRAQLPVNSDPDADWAELNSLLDQHLPVAPSVKTGKLRFKGFKFLPSVLIAVSAAAMVYLALHLYGGQSNRRMPVSKHDTKAGLLADSQTGAAGLSPNNAGKKGRSAGDDTITGTTASGSGHFTGSDNTAPANEKYPSGKSNTKGNSSGPDGSNSKAIFNRGNSNMLSAGGSPGSAGGAKITGHAWKPVAGRNVRNAPDKLLNTGTGITGVARAASHSWKFHAGRNPRYHTNKLLSANAGKTGHPPINQSGQQGRITGDTKANQLGNQWGLTGLDVVSAGIDPGGNSNARLMQAMALPAFRIGLSEKATANGKNRQKKPAKPFPLDWGITIGANSSGSFTPASQNHNFYGSLPVDIYPGLFATFILNKNWGLNTEAQFYSSQTLHTSYTHANQSSVDSTQALSITASGKLYSLIVPVSLVYKTNSHFFIKGGPVISFPIKQTGLTNSFGPAALKADSAYYAQTRATVNGTVYRQNINLGFSAGIGEQFNRWILGVTYLRSLSGYTISSSFGNYKSYNGTLRFSIGFQLDKVKP